MKGMTAKWIARRKASPEARIYAPKKLSGRSKVCTEVWWFVTGDDGHLTRLDVHCVMRNNVDLWSGKAD